MKVTFDAWFRVEGTVEAESLKNALDMFNKTVRKGVQPYSINGNGSLIRALDENAVDIQQEFDTRHYPCKYCATYVMSPTSAKTEAKSSMSLSFHDRHPQTKDDWRVILRWIHILRMTPRQDLIRMLDMCMQNNEISETT